MKIKGIKRNTNRHGKTYFYDRVSGKRIFAEYGTNEFIAEVAEHRAGSSIRRSSRVIETFGDLKAVFQNDPEYIALGERSKEDYEAVFNYLLPIDGVRLCDIDTPFVSEIKRRAHDARSWSFANKVLASISRMFNWGFEPGFTNHNPAEKVAKFKRPRDAKTVHRRWHDHELEMVLKHADPSLRTAIALGAHTGMRVGDAIALPLSAVTDVIRITQSKTDKSITIPIHSNLHSYIKEARQRPGRNAVTLVIGKRGRTLTTAGFKSMFFKMLRELEKQGLIASGLTFHGLRHTVGTRLAEAGASDSVIQSMLGHKTPAMAQRYRRDAAQKGGAEIAMDLLEKRAKEER